MLPYVGLSGIPQGLVQVLGMGELGVFGAGLTLHLSACAAGLHAERAREGDRSAENHGEGPGQAAAQGHDGSSAQRQPQSQRAGQGAEQLAAGRRHR